MSRRSGSWVIARRYKDYASFSSSIKKNCMQIFKRTNSASINHHPDPSLIYRNVGSNPSSTLLSHNNINWDTRSAVVYPNIISEKEATNLISILTPKFQRRRYEQGHWDSVIQNYREIELLDEETDDLKSFLQPIRQFLEDHHSGNCCQNSTSSNDETNPKLYLSSTWFPCHAIDLHKDGALMAHVDSVRFSGNVVAGLSLLSDSIMRLKPVKSDLTINESDTKQTLPAKDAIENNEYVDLLLPSRSLYVLGGMSRYEYSHELLPSGSVFNNITPIQRSRRLSVMFRDGKP